MKTKLNFFFSKTILWIVITLTPIISFSQIREPVIAVDSSMTEKPKAIPYFSVIHKIEEANQNIKLVENKIQSDSDIVKIDSLYPVYSLFIQEKKSKAENFIKSNPNRQKVNNLIKKWEGYQAQFERWESTINDTAEKNITLYDGIYFDEQTWDLTYQNALIEKYPSEILNDVRTIWGKTKKTKKSIISKINDLLKLQSEVIKQKSVTAKVIEDLIALKHSEVYDLFYLRHDPLWKASFNTTLNEHAEKEESESISENISGISELIKTSQSKIIIYLIMVVLFVLLIIVLKKYFKTHEFNVKERNLQNVKEVILNHSLATIIFLSLVIAKLFFTNTPTLFDDVLVLLILVASIALLKPFIHKHFNNIIYFISLFYVLDNAKTYIWFNSWQYRIYLLTEAIIAIAILFLFIHPYIKTRKLDVNKFGLFLIRLSPLIYLLNIISILSNILGYTNLTDITLKISIQSGVVTIIFYGVLMIAGGISTGLIHRHFTNKETFDENKALLFTKKTWKIIRVIAFIYWFVVFLRMIDLFRPLTESLTNIFQEPYKVGTVIFTIGEIVTFIIILSASFLSTSFISYLLDKDGVSLQFLKLKKGIPAAISLVIRYFIIAFGFILALSSLGIDLSNFNLMAGALGLGIGFGLQTIISNFVSGLILVFERPILPGDTVEVNNLLGTVNRIGVRSSNIRTFDGAEVVVPNNNLIANDLINWTLSDNIKRVEILIGTTYGSDPNEILEILVNVAKENPDSLNKPAPAAFFNEFGDSSLNFRLLFWVHYERGFQAKSDVSIGIYNRFKELGIEIPFPQQNVYIKELPKQEKKVDVSNK